MEFAADSIRRFHEDQKPEEMWLHEIRPGAFAGERTRPIPSVACYVPRGKGAFPSVALMSTIPARVAGVPEIVIVTPPGPDGRIDAATLVAARMSGIDRVFKAGGAQGVAAVAYGTATVPRVAKIVGPGSPWVVAAKRRVAHLIDTGTPAGPSELIVLADDTRRRPPRRPRSADRVRARPRQLGLPRHLEPPRRRGGAGRDPRLLGERWASSAAASPQAVLGGPIGGIVLARDEAAAIAFVNDYAPEHLEILSNEPFRYLGRIEHAGEILLGRAQRR